MRFTLLEWLVTVARTLDFSLETWCLAVNYLDRFLCHQQIGKDCLQLVGLTAVWIAAKQGQMSMYKFRLERSCKRSETFFTSLLFLLAGEVSWLPVEVLSPCQK